MLPEGTDQNRTLEEVPIRTLHRMHIKIQTTSKQNIGESAYQNITPSVYQNSDKGKVPSRNLQTTKKVK